MLNNNNFQDAIAYHNQIRKDDLENRLKKIVNYNTTTLSEDQKKTAFFQIKREISECLVIDQYIQGVTGDIDTDELSTSANRILKNSIENYRLEKNHIFASEQIDFLHSIEIHPNWVKSEESIEDTVNKAIDYYGAPIIIDALAIKGYIPIDRLSNWFVEQLKIIDDFELKKEKKSSDLTESHDNQSSNIVPLKRRVKTDKHFGQGSSTLDRIKDRSKSESVVGMSGFQSADHLTHCKWAILQHLTHYQRMSLSEANREIHWCITRAKNGESDILVEKYFNRELDCSTPEYIDPVTNKVSKMLAEFIIYSNYQPDTSRGAIVSRVHNKMQDHSYLLKMWNEMQLEISYVLDTQRDGIVSRYGHKGIKSAEELMTRSSMNHMQDSLPNWYHLGMLPDLTQLEKELNAQKSNIELRRSYPDQFGSVSDEEVRKFAHETFLKLQAQKIKQSVQFETKRQQNPNV